MDRVHVHYSYRHPCLLTISVDGLSGQSNSSGPVNTEEWHLPSFDPRNETKYLYKLHTLDVYFWTKEDAQKFLGVVRRLLPVQQITIVDEPSHTDEVSSVVQNLENVAITDSSYQQGSIRHSRDTSISSSIHGSQASAIQAVRDTNRSSTSSGSVAAPPQAGQVAPGFAPLAYNPAAPAAPEAIQYREKTPPPEDGGAANPLAAAANADQGQTFGVPYPGMGGFSGPPPSALSPPLQSPQQPFFSGHPVQPPQVLSSPLPQQPQVQSPVAQHFQNHFAPPPTTATVPPPAYTASATPSSSNSNYPSAPVAGMYNPSVSPPGGFAAYDYNPGLSNTRPMMTDYSIHSQVYRPTEGEYKVKSKPAKPPAGKLEARAGQVEKGVNGLLKKLEKKIG